MNQKPIQEDKNQDYPPMNTLQFSSSYSSFETNTNPYVSYLNSRAKSHPKDSSFPEQIPTIIDMETGDPDDYFNVIELLCHPRICVKCITVTPGTKEQISFVRCFLDEIIIECQQYVQNVDHNNDMISIIERLRNIKIGAYKPDHNKNCLGGFFTKMYPNSTDEKYLKQGSDDFGYNLMHQCWKEYGNQLMFVTGAPLSNLGTFIEKYSHEMNEQNRIGLCVIQGGFAGDNVTPHQFRLSKFAGKTKVSTYNFGGNIKAAKTVLNCPFIDKRLLVSKNVCHGVVYGKDRHMQLKERLTQLEYARTTFTSQQHLSFIGLSLIFKGMQKYLEKNQDGKKFHDVLAGCVSIEPNICIFKRVEVIEEKNQWGSKESTNSNTFVSIAANLDSFFDVMMMRGYL